MALVEQKLGQQSRNATQHYNFRDKDSIKNLFYKIKNSEYANFKNTDFNQKITLYGYGDLGKLAFDFLNHENLNIYRIIDKKFDDKIKQKNKSNIIFSNPGFIQNESDETCLISIVNSSLANILKDISNLKFKRVIPFYDFVESYNCNYPISNGWFTGALTKKEWGKIDHVINSLSDEKSKANYIQFLAWRFCRDEYHIHPFQIIQNRYQPSFLNNIKKKHEAYTDIGSHNGSAFEQIYNFFQRKIYSAYFFEPDSKNFTLLKKKIKKSSYPSCKLNFFNVSLSNKNGVVKFHDGYNYLSKISNYGSVNVKKLTLDEYQIIPTLLKIHVEGEELNVLKGSIETIKYARPIIFVTTYHNIDGLYKIPIFLFKNLLNYTFYFRIHGWFGCSAMLYCIPDERMY